MAGFLAATMGGVVGFTWLKMIQLQEVERVHEASARVLNVAAKVTQLASQGAHKPMQGARTEQIHYTDAPEFEIGDKLKSVWNASVRKVSQEVLPLTDPAKAQDKLASDVVRLRRIVQELQDRANKLLK